MTPDDPRHGTVNGYVNLACRCAPCRSAWNDYVKVKRARRATLLAPDDPRHGTNGLYVNYSCRCAPCTAAHTARDRELRARRAAVE